jgi:hypothetical protein
LLFLRTETPPLGRDNKFNHVSQYIISACLRQATSWTPVQGVL